MLLSRLRGAAQPLCSVDPAKLVDGSARLAAPVPSAVRRSSTLPRPPSGRGAIGTGAFLAGRSPVPRRAQLARPASAALLTSSLVLLLATSRLASSSSASSSSSSRASLSRFLDSDWDGDGSGGMMGAKASMVSKEAALPGRERPIEDFAKLKHYVLGTPLVIAEGSDKDGWVSPEGVKLGRAVFANGCFWGGETSAWTLPGVYSTAVGYTGGFTPNPTYEEVCSGMTGHTEATQVFWDKSKITFADLMRLFLQNHDPTTPNRQGSDAGTQYRSAVSVTNEEDLAVARAAIAAYEKQIGKRVVSEVFFPPPPFYYAEEYHQQYLAKPGSRPYCSAQPMGVQLADAKTWLPAGAAAPRLPEAYWDKHAPVEGCVLRRPKAQVKWEL